MIRQQEICLAHVCFVPIDASNEASLFGFSEYLATIALLTIVFTIADPHYKFRIAVTPGGHLYPLTFFVLLATGVQALLLDLLVSHAWLVPRTALLDQSIWQTTFGFLFLSTFSTWMYYALIHPPIFGPNNAELYASTLFDYLVRGNEPELRAAANELARSADQIVTYCPRPKSSDATPTEDYAFDILHLVGNREFCAQVVNYYPETVHD